MVRILTECKELAVIARAHSLLRSYHNSVPTSELLLERGADINGMRFRRQPLHYNKLWTSYLQRLERCHSTVSPWYKNA